jgi:hypothetical protein
MAAVRDPESQRMASITEERLRLEEVIEGLLNSFERHGCVVRKVERRAGSVYLDIEMVGERRRDLRAR